jgi:hypothetical protein
MTEPEQQPKPDQGEDVDTEWPEVPEGTEVPEEDTVHDPDLDPTDDDEAESGAG